VHGILERVDFAVFCDAAVAFDTAVAGVLPTADDLTDDERAHVVRTLSQARGSRVLARAAAATVCRRELPISGHAEADGVLTVTVGSIDLLIGEDGTGPAGREGRRWVLVDYKTDTTGRAVEEFIARYAPQLAVYERLLADCGIAVAEKWLVRLGSDGVQDVRVP
jgi:ATP-dependent exoDNAse (exonuclease V) beta subunit